MVFYIAMLQLIVHPSDELPIYRQIMRQIVEAIAGGRLRRGDKLTSHRELAEQLVVAPLTVKKAYDELELLGYVETQRGRGTFICERPPKPKPAEQRERMRAAARKLLAEAYVGGLRLKDMEEILREADREIASGQAAPPGGVRREKEES
jgi:GntR family transcriptional regulator